MTSGHSPAVTSPAPLGPPPPTPAVPPGLAAAVNARLQRVADDLGVVLDWGCGCCGGGVFLDAPDLEKWDRPAVDGVVSVFSPRGG